MCMYAGTYGTLLSEINVNKQQTSPVAKIFLYKHFTANKKLKTNQQSKKKMRIAINLKIFLNVLINKIIKSHTMCHWPNCQLSRLEFHRKTVN